MIGLVIKSTGKNSLVKAKNKVYKCTLRGNFRLENNFSNPIVSGDLVKIKIDNNENGIITEIFERENLFIKKSLKDNKAHVVGSNIDQILIICSFKKPYTKLIFIDKCISAANFYNIKPIIVFNKIDLLKPEEINKLKEIKKKYSSIGINFCKISATNKFNLEVLNKLLKNKKTLFIGNSGVGKSTIINLISKSNQKIDSLSSKTERGKQTTTFSEIFEIDSKSLIVDSPGFKDFYFYDIEKEDVKYLFKEFIDIQKKCKFNNCLHLNEPNCEIKKNIGNKIWSKRFSSYLSIIKELS
ncbi:MAG: ribosome small subunit-dependent GTPase A [Flammeovirgaceae bacterium TMED290]|nr:MAG: ribosome small subunit-dependent GTPase A [Flammeovirgaceae bacterium TMED290]|tara:strand:+ start:23678 stop:24571 length:894 start_codon:yes stop_codon:yes gene_type:complete